VCKHSRKQTYTQKHTAKSRAGEYACTVTMNVRPLKVSVSDSDSVINRCESICVISKASRMKVNS